MTSVGFLWRTLHFVIHTARFTLLLACLLAYSLLMIARYLQLESTGQWLNYVIVGLVSTGPISQSQWDWATGRRTGKRILGFIIKKRREDYCQDDGLIGASRSAEGASDCVRK